MRRSELSRKVCDWLGRISPEAVGRAVKRSIEGCWIVETGNHSRGSMACCCVNDYCVNDYCINKL